MGGTLGVWEVGDTFPSLEGVFGERRVVKRRAKRAPLVDAALLKLSSCRRNDALVQLQQAEDSATEMSARQNFT